MTTNPAQTITTPSSVAETPLPIAVIGAGPIGLVAAAHLLSRGETPIVLEAGDAAGASIREWSHVRLFSPWKYLIDPTARRLLEASGWEAPHPERLPTGGELLAEFLEPLAALPVIAPHLRLGHRVIAVTRRGMDKVKTAGREATPFELVVRRTDGSTERLLARAVIDASGTWRSPNPVGAGGVPAAGEVEHAARVDYGIPDVLGRDRGRFAGRRTLVVGSGHSAFNALLDLAALRMQAPGTEVVWAVRRQDVGLMFGGGQKDALEARGALGVRLRRLVAEHTVEFVRGFRLDGITDRNGRLTVTAEDGRTIDGLDQLIVTTGFRPDLTLARELRLKLNPWLEAPEQLAPLIDPNLHSCGTVYPHGAAELAHPEKDFYVVGMKSYGRAPTFLLLTGYEQVRSVVCALAGDEEGARQVELVLPETGVCQTDLSGSSCCSVSDEQATAEPAALVPLGRLAGAAALAEAAEIAPTAGGCGCGSVTTTTAAATGASKCCG
ncbi:MAG: FAD-dependent oxidoreductase [Gemmatimonadales bacterium]|nr:FAD-dependent oxidoreductase [Gemmatimonadales bacterium]